MSSERDQPTLGSFASTPSPHEERLDGVGAEYVGADDATPAQRPHAAENQCRNCGSSIRSHVARVVGDNDGCVPYCAECRGDVLDEHQLGRGEYESTVRLVYYLRDQQHGGDER